MTSSRNGNSVEFSFLRDNDDTLPSELSAKSFPVIPEYLSKAQPKGWIVEFDETTMLKDAGSMLSDLLAGRVSRRPRNVRSKKKNKKKKKKKRKAQKTKRKKQTDHVEVNTATEQAITKQIPHRHNFLIHKEKAERMSTIKTNIVTEAASDAPLPTCMNKNILENVAGNKNLHPIGTQGSSPHQHRRFESPFNGLRRGGPYLRIENKLQHYQQNPHLLEKAVEQLHLQQRRRLLKSREKAIANRNILHENLNMQVHRPKTTQSRKNFNNARRKIRSAEVKKRYWCITKEKQQKAEFTRSQQQTERLNKLQATKRAREVLIILYTFNSFLAFKKALNRGKIIHLAARAIQRSWRWKRMVQRIRKFRLAFNIVSRALKGYIKLWRQKQLRKAAHLVISFLKENRFQLVEVMMQFRRKVIDCQRICRDFLACRNARILALSHWWSKLEARYAEELHDKKMNHHRLLLESVNTTDTLRSDLLQLVSERSNFGHFKLSPVLGSIKTSTRNITKRKKKAMNKHRNENDTLNTLRRELMAMRRDNMLASIGIGRPDTSSSSFVSSKLTPAANSSFMDRILLGQLAKNIKKDKLSVNKLPAVPMGIRCHLLKQFICDIRRGRGTYTGPRALEGKPVYSARNETIQNRIFTLKDVRDTFKNATRKPNVALEEQCSDTGQKVTHLGVSTEAIFFRNETVEGPTTYFPLHSILSWGFDDKCFKFRLLDKSLNTAFTKMGKQIESKIMEAALKLKSQMNSVTIPAEALTILIEDIRNANETSITSKIQKFSITHKFSVNQAVQVLTAVFAKNDPFENVEVACALYERLLDKDSFQLILNMFVDQEERLNLTQRLQLQ
eukprot:g2935.t1